MMKRSSAGMLSAILDQSGVTMNDNPKDHPVRLTTTVSGAG
jgi:hypothetical protein